MEITGLFYYDLCMTQQAFDHFVATHFRGSAEKTPPLDWRAGLTAAEKTAYDHSNEQQGRGQAYVKAAFLLSTGAVIISPPTAFFIAAPIAGPLATYGFAKSVKHNVNMWRLAKAAERRLPPALKSGLN